MPYTFLRPAPAPAKPKSLQQRAYETGARDAIRSGGAQLIMGNNAEATLFVNLELDGRRIRVDGPTVLREYKRGYTDQVRDIRTWPADCRRSKR